MVKLIIGSSPCLVEPVQVGTPNYAIHALRECAIFRDQLARHYEGVHGKKPACLLTINTRQHDFGDYYEVCACFNDGDAAAEEAAYWIEANAPEEWDLEALAAFSRQYNTPEHSTMEPRT